MGAASICRAEEHLFYTLLLNYTSYNITVLILYLSNDAVSAAKVIKSYVR
jgi:hypothetical protein